LLALAGITVGGLGCVAQPTDPMSTGPGAAFVTGIVSTAAGAPIPTTTVRISCPGMGVILGATDSTGRYSSSLHMSEYVFERGDGKTTCHFTEPASGPTRAQRNAILGFEQGPVFLVMQTVELQER
jgi:hypothetical protein